MFIGPHFMRPAGILRHFREENGGIPAQGQDYDDGGKITTGLNSRASSTVIPA